MPPCSTCTDESRCDRAGLCQCFKLQLPQAAHDRPNPHLAWVVEWGAIGLPLGHPSRVTCLSIHHDEQDAAEACYQAGKDFNARMWPIALQVEGRPELVAEIAGRAGLTHGVPVAPAGYVLLPVKPEGVIREKLLRALEDAGKSECAGTVQGASGHLYDALIAAAQGTPPVPGAAPMATLCVPGGVLGAGKEDGRG